MTALATIVPHADEAAWHEARRPVVTATQIRDWATGRASDRARLLIEKLLGRREDLAGIKYIEWGKFREPFLQDWVKAKYGINPVQNDLYINGDDPRWACTPDGYADSFGIITLSELKTTKKALDRDSGAFLESCYEDQVQWEMLVCGADQVLFVYEQHDDHWDPWPEPYPPQAFWIKRDQKRIDKLIGMAGELLDLVGEWEAAYTELLQRCASEVEADLAERALIEHIQADHTSTEGLEQRWLFLVGGDQVPETDPLKLGILTEDLEELAAIVIEARADEAEAKKRKEEAWAKIKKLTASHDDFKAIRNGYTIGWTTSRGVKPVVDVDGMRAKAPSIVKRYEDLQARFTTEEPTETRTLTVTRQTED